jgi:hypothetical protein
MEVYVAKELFSEKLGKYFLQQALNSTIEFYNFVLAFTIRNPFPTAPVNLSGKNLVSWPESIAPEVIRVEAKIIERIVNPIV